MTDQQIHEVHMAAISLKMMPHDKHAAVDRMIADGRAEMTGPFDWRLTPKGIEWLGAIG